MVLFAFKHLSLKFKLFKHRICIVYTFFVIAAKRVALQNSSHRCFWREYSAHKFVSAIYAYSCPEKILYHFFKEMLWQIKNFLLLMQSLLLITEMYYLRNLLKWNILQLILLNVFNKRSNLLNLLCTCKDKRES